MDTTRTVTPNIVRIVVRAAARRNVAADRLLDSVGLSATTTASGGGSVPRDAERALWSEATRRSRDPALGLHAAESLEVGTLGVVEYLARTGATLRDAWTAIGRHYRLIHEDFWTAIEVTRGVACVHQVLAGPADLAPQCSEFVLATLLLLARQATGRDVVPLAVSFQHPRPAAVAAHQRLFRCRLRFGAHRNEIRLDPALLDLPLVQRDPALHQMLECFATELEARLPAGTRLGARVQACVAEQLGHGNASAAHAAKRLHMSTRQLQRRLASEGTTFRDLRQALRRSLAIRYLCEEQRSPAEVAYLLGFADPSSFHRAFKRWTGTTPATCRKV